MNSNYKLCTKIHVYMYYMYFARNFIEVLAQDIYMYFCAQFVIRIHLYNMYVLIG